MAKTIAKAYGNDSSKCKKLHVQEASRQSVKLIRGEHFPKPTLMLMVVDTSLLLEMGKKFIHTLGDQNEYNSYKRIA